MSSESAFYYRVSDEAICASNKQDDLCKLPESHNKSTSSICDPLPTPHFTDGLLGTVLYTILNTERVCGIRQLGLEGVGEFFIGTWYERQSDGVCA